MALTAGQGGALVLALLAVFFSRDLYSLMQGSPEVRTMTLEHSHRCLTNPYHDTQRTHQLDGIMTSSQEAKAETTAASAAAQQLDQQSLGGRVHVSFCTS